MKQKKEIRENLQDLVKNPGSERNLLSICLKDSNKVIDLQNAELYSEHFGISGNQYIYTAIMYLFEKKVKPTALTINEVLSGENAKASIEELGGLDYLMTLEDNDIPVENLSIFIEKVKQSYTRRMLLSIAEDIKNFAISSKAEVLNPQELTSFAEAKVNDLVINNAVTEEVYKMGDKTDEVLEARAENPNQVPGLEVGWTEFDSITNGGQPGDLIVIVAPSKTGKSVLLTNFATNMSILGDVPILYFDTEMNEREQEDRILSNLSGVPQKEIVSGMYVVDTEYGKAEDKVKRIKDARDKLKMGNYYHIYMPQFTIEKVTALARRFVSQFGVKAIYFDYIKIPSNQANFKEAQEFQKLGFFTSGLKDLAGMLKIPVYTACQTNRNNAGFNDDPNESDIGGSYRILQLASKLMFLYNKSDEEIAKQTIQNGNQKLIIKWQRNGASDCPPINIMFYKNILRQVEC